MPRETPENRRPPTKTAIRPYAATLVVMLLLIATAMPALGHGDTLSGEQFEYEGGEVASGIPVDGPSGSIDRSPEVLLLAELHGIDLDDALALAKWMEEAERSVIDVRREYPETFAGSEFVHDSGFVRLDLWVVGDGLLEIQSLRKKVPIGERTAVGIRQAPKSEIELEMEVELAAKSYPEQLGVSSAESVIGRLDFKTGAFVPETAERLATFSLDGHDKCTHGTGGWIEGGRHLFFTRHVEEHYDESDGCVEDQGFCTSGFTAKLNGYQGVITAGHCMEDYSVGYRNGSLMYANGTELIVSLRNYLSDTLPDDDVGFMREVYASADPRGRIYLGPSNGWRDITGLLPDPPPLNAVRCIKSASGNDIGSNPPNHDLGYKCGLVNSSSYCKWGFCRFTKVHNDDWGDFPREASSGGPWFFSNSAAGVHSFSYTDQGIYYRLDRAKLALPGLSIYCGGANEYLCSWP